MRRHLPMVREHDILGGEWFVHFSAAISLALPDSSPVGAMKRRLSAAMLAKADLVGTAWALLLLRWWTLPTTLPVDTPLAAGTFEVDFVIDGDTLQLTMANACG